MRRDICIGKPIESCQTLYQLYIKSVECCTGSERGAVEWKRWEGSGAGERWWDVVGGGGKWCDVVGGVERWWKVVEGGGDDGGCGGDGERREGKKGV